MKAGAPARSYNAILWLWVPAFAGTTAERVASAHAFYVSRNLTGSPVEGVTTSPCHIARFPRTKVPTGHPVTRTPSYGVQPAFEAIYLLVLVSLRFMPTTVKSAS